MTTLIKILLCMFGFLLFASIFTYNAYGERLEIPLANPPTEMTVLLLEYDESFPLLVIPDGDTTFKVAYWTNETNKDIPFKVIKTKDKIISDLEEIKKLPKMIDKTVKLKENETALDSFVLTEPIIIEWGYNSTIVYIAFDSTTGNDTYITNSSATTNYETSSTIYAGENDINALYVFLIDLRYAFNSLPLYSIINSATLRLNVTYNEGGANISCYPINNTVWTESTVTWNNIAPYNASINRSLKVGNFSRLNNTYGLVNMSLNITYIQGYYNNPGYTSRHGILCEGQKLTNLKNKVLGFASSDNYAADPTGAPTLILDYDMPSLPYWVTESGETYSTIYENVYGYCNATINSSFPFANISYRIYQNKTVIASGNVTQWNTTWLYNPYNITPSVSNTNSNYTISCLVNASNAINRIWYNSTNMQVYPILVDNCSSYTYFLLNFTYQDQLTNELINISGGYDIIFEPLFNSISLTTINISALTDTAVHSGFCSNIDMDNDLYSMQVSGEITATKSEYATQFVNIPEGSLIIEDNQTYPIYLIRLNESSTVVFTWLTSTYTPVDGTMFVYECLGDGSRNLIAGVPITGGDANANIVLINTPYAYTVSYRGEIYTDYTDYSACHIESQTTRQYIIDIGTSISPTIGLYSIDCNITKTSNTTVAMRWGINLQNDDVITGCIFAQRIEPTGATLVYTNCTNTSPIIRTLPSSGYNYNVYGKLYQSGYSIACKDHVDYHVDKRGADAFGLSGIFAILLLIVSMMLIFSNESPMWYPIMGVGGLILAFILGITAFGWVTISALMFFVIIILMIGRYHRQE